MSTACHASSTVPSPAANVAAALGDARVVILDREPNPYAATFDGEIVRCRWPDGTERRLFCKVGGRHPDNPDDDHGGVAYEVAVYRDVLVPTAMSPLRFWGSHCDEASGVTSLLVDHLDGATRSDRAHDPSRALATTAQWIGRFHSAAASRVHEASASFLVRRDAEHYLRWHERTAAFAGQGWLEPVVRHYPSCVDTLVSRPVTIIHGDYYADNALVEGDRVCPIDWGWAAVAPGEIDLASLTEGWPADVCAACRGGYVEGRWGAGGADPGFEGALLAARFYHLFRWLGHRADWVGTQRWERRLERLRLLSQQTGLIV